MHDPLRWADWLERIARPALADLPDALSRNGVTPSDAPAALEYIERFTDERGNRRPVDPPLLGWMLGVPPPRDGRPLSRDAALWWALCSPGSPSPEPLFEHPTGPLVPEARDSGFESWTEAELSALHALWHLGRVRKDDVILQRCRAAVAWHLAEIQPDNGTNRPWATHVFVWASDQFPDAMMHAQTLVHNACVERGRPERFSALLLLDASRAMRTL
jgi:hypothetical protein